MLGLGLGLAAIVLLLDQATKWVFYEALTGFSFWGPAPAPLPRGPVVEVTGFFNLVTVWNYGVSFGMFNRGAAESAWIFALVAGAITLVLVVWLVRAPVGLVAVSCSPSLS